MAMLPELEKYHSMSPKDVGLSGEKKQVTVIDVARTTNHTGEQFHVAVPVYAEDTRQELRDRIYFFLSIVQERLEEENRAIQVANDRNQKLRNVQATVKRNALHFQKQLAALQKRAKKEKWQDEEFLAERTKLLKGLKDANHQLISSLESEEDRKTISDEVPEAVPETEAVVHQ